MQSFSQVSDALIHHRHLGVPLVQQLLVLGQLAALLQVMTVTSLKHTTSQALHILWKRFLTKSTWMCCWKKEIMRWWNLPAAPGRVSSVPGLQGPTGVILSGQWVHPGTQGVPPELVQQSAAEGVLFSNPPTAGSTGKTIQKELNNWPETQLCLILTVTVKPQSTSVTNITWSTLTTADCSSACFSWNRLLTWSISAAGDRNQEKMGKYK